jgi:peroxiredoxin Q/BCP
MLADSDKTAAKAFGVLSGMGFASRWTFYIGKDGKILYVDRDVSPKTAGADTASRLAALGIAKRG